MDKNQKSKMKPLSKRKAFDILRTQLESERSSFISHWRDLGEHIFPRRPRFTTSENNKGDRKNQKIIDATATLAARTLRSGMMSGVTSPARPWFRLAVPSPELMESALVKDWLHVTSERMTAVFIKSNLYNVLPVVYGDMGVFGTSAAMIEEDFEDVVRFYSFPIGSYAISTDEKGKVNVFYREFAMTVRQIVSKFGRVDQEGEIDWSNISLHVKSLYENGQTEQWIDICHIIQPNEEYDGKKLESKFKKFKSCYFEKGSGGDKSRPYYASDEDQKVLREAGYDYFPVFCPRWEVTGEDQYGTECPGMIALGDVKALQLMQKKKAQAIEKMVNPPLVGPSSIQNSRISLLPGDTSFADVREGQQGLRPIHEVNPRINELIMDIQEYQRRIQRAFYEDLFLMLANSDRRQITAREIDERHEEKLLALGPVLEQLNQDLLDPLIDVTFQIMFNQGLIPEPPEEIQGMDLRVEYISIMAQAQKLAGIASIERFAGFASSVMQANPEVMDKVDMDQMIDVYADRLSLQPGIVRPDEKVAEIRAGRAQQQQTAQAVQSLQAGAQTVRDLSSADMEGDNALTRLIQNANAGALTRQ